MTAKEALEHPYFEGMEEIFPDHLHIRNNLN
jgi:hypothetical protein